MSVTTRALAGAASLALAAAIPVGAAAAPAEVPDRPHPVRGGHPLNPAACETLTGYRYEDTVITSAKSVRPGEETFRGRPVARHCLVKGTMEERGSLVDGETYAIGFEMRLPMHWDGRFVYQANGGLDGAVAPALGTAGGSDSALQSGSAVISSDAGHTSEQNPVFGLDPQARLNYGHRAVQALTPMAKDLVEHAYGVAPHHSYIVGSSNGGRHAMVAASRSPELFDGVLAVAPGFNLPKAAVAQLWGAQQWSTVAESEDLASALTQDEREAVADGILASCDALDGLEDGMVQDSAGFQEEFSVADDVPTCAQGRTGSCLTTEQKQVLERVFSGATTSDGEAIYAPFVHDPGLVQEDWGAWKFSAPLTRDSAAVGYIFSSAPFAPALRTLSEWALSVDIDEAFRRIHATDGVYAESAMEFMTPPDLEYRDFIAAGGRMLVIHGASDGVFSMQDTADWYEGLDEAHHGQVDRAVRFFQVPGMGHTRGGPATDQHDAVRVLTDWVEDAEAPDRIEARVDPANAELPSTWSTSRTRPLCAYPATAEYTGGDPESAASFTCAGR